MPLAVRLITPFLDSRRWLCFVIFILLSATAMAIEEPKYAVTKSDAGPDGNIELRLYEPMIVAEVLVEGSMDKASSQGFRMIAGYIFGGNTSQSGDVQKISMTAPVTLSSEKINMTAPVTLQQDSGLWRVHFVMPSEHSMASLPVPNDERVKLREVEPASYAAIRFSGLAGEKKVAQKTQELLAWMEKEGLVPSSKPELARYNPPWTPPFMRRNEVLIAY